MLFFFWPTFGYSSGISIGNKFFSNQGEVHIKMNRLKNTENYELNGGNQYFKFVEVEIFQIIFD